VPGQEIELLAVGRSGPSWWQPVAQPLVEVRIVPPGQKTQKAVPPGQRVQQAAPVEALIAPENPPPGFAIQGSTVLKERL